MPKPSPDIAARADAHALPEAFLTRLAQIVPTAHYDAVLDTFAAPRATGFRVNTLRATPADVWAALDATGLRYHRVPWMDTAAWVAPAHRAALLATEAYAAHHLYIQNLSSMVPPLVLGTQPGERVLDLAAAPGSKTLQIASDLGQTGELAAVEVVRNRFFKLRDNLEAQGATQVRTFLKDGMTVWRHRPEYFDRVLLDAPCSTEGRFHITDPKTFAYWSPRKIKEMAHKQRKLLYSALQCVRPGGVVVYATCSFAPEENEAVLNKLLRRFDGAVTLEPLDVALPNLQPPLSEWKGHRFKADLSAARRLLPTDRMEAFFVARMRKHTSTQ